MLHTILVMVGKYLLVGALLTPVEAYVAGRHGTAHDFGDSVAGVLLWPMVAVLYLSDIAHRFGSKSFVNTRQLKQAEQDKARLLEAEEHARARMEAMLETHDKPASVYPHRGERATCPECTAAKRRYEDTVKIVDRYLLTGQGLQ